MNAFMLKLIAIFTMAIDHLGAVFPERFGLEFRAIGRVAFPLFVFFIAEGFRHSKNRPVFLVRLAAFAIISQPFFNFAFHNRVPAFGDGVSLGTLSFSFFQDTNIFYTLFFGAAAICAFDFLRKWLANLPPIGMAKSMQQLLDEFMSMPLVSLCALLPVAVLMWLANFLGSDYGAHGVLFIFTMYVLGPIGPRLFAMALFSLYQHEWMLTFALQGYEIPFIFWVRIPATLVAVLLVAFYNGNRGPGLKWFFYVFYPAHLALYAAIFHFGWL